MKQTEMTSSIMLSKKVLIINAISEMNISMLEILLDDNKAYQNATKETFIEKLGEVFEKLKKFNDTMLLYHSGICESKQCPNKGCRGFAFVGNVSNISMALILNESENDFTDIFQCSNFKTDNKSVKTKNEFKVDIKEDEKISFNPKPERLEIFQECKKAFNEIMKLDTDILTKDKLLKWIDDYYWLREELKNSTYFLPFIYRSIDNFRDLYNDLDNVAKHIPFEIPTFKAMKEFQNIDIANERELLSWLVAYEGLRYDLSKLYDPFDSCGVVKMNYLRIHKQPQIKIDLTDFCNIIRFKNDFDKNYWSKHSKYKAYTDEECRKPDSNSHDYKNRFSLKYQLEKRGIQL